MGYHPQVPGINISVGLSAGVQQIFEGPPATIDSTDILTLRVTNLVQQTDGGDPTHIADVTCVIYGTGSYDGTIVTLKTVEFGSSASGPWTDITPAGTVQATASPTGTSFTFEVEPNLWSGVVSIYIRVVVTPTALADIEDIGGAYTWDGDIVPGIPATITVPASASSTFTVSWASVVGATGYTVQEGIQQPDLSVVWGSTVYTGSGTSVALTKAAGYVYWYRVRSYNPVPNYSGYRTSANGCSLLQPTVYISPDLGWASATKMLDPAINVLAQQFALSSLEESDLPDIGYISQTYRVLTTTAKTVLLPLATVKELPGNNVRYLFRLDLGTVGSFISRKSTGAV